MIRSRATASLIALYTSNPLNKIITKRERERFLVAKLVRIVSTHARLHREARFVSNDIKLKKEIDSYTAGERERQRVCERVFVYACVGFHHAWAKLRHATRPLCLKRAGTGEWGYFM